MESEAEKGDIQTQVLRTTLAEISTSRPNQGVDCCVICLDEISDPSTAHPCGHANFDFLCLVNWAQLHPTCPLCKAVIREVRYGASASEGGTETDFKVYKVPQQDEQKATARSNVEVPQSTASSQRTFEHYFLGRHRSHRHRGQGGSSRREPVPAPLPIPTLDEAILRRRHIYRNQLYSLHVGSNRLSQYRDLTPELFASDPHLVSRARQWLRRELQVFEFLSSGSGSSGNNNPSTTQNSSNNNSNSNSGTEEADERTRQRQRQRRRRRANNAEFLLEYTVAILKTVDVQGSAGQAEAMLTDFLGRDCARLLLHELRAWLRSPHGSLAAWDRAVQYPEPNPHPKPGSRSGSAKRRADDDEGAVGGTDDCARGGRGSETGAGMEVRPRGDYWRPRKRRSEWGVTTDRRGEGRAYVRRGDVGGHVPD